MSLTFSRLIDVTDFVPHHMMCWDLCHTGLAVIRLWCNTDLKIFPKNSSSFMRGSDSSVGRVVSGLNAEDEISHAWDSKGLEIKKIYSETLNKSSMWRVLLKGLESVHALNSFISVYMCRYLKCLTDSRLYPWKETVFNATTKVLTLNKSQQAGFVIKIYLVSVSNYSRSVLIHVICSSSNWYIFIKIREI